MDEIVDTECLPDQEAVSQFRGTDDNNTARRPLEIWKKLSLTEEKRQVIVNDRVQQEAIWELAKEGLAQKLQTFSIMYSGACIVVMIFRAVVSRSLPQYRLPQDFLVFIGSNFIYLGFLMSLSLFYGLYTELGSRVALAAVLLIISALAAQEWLVAPGPLTVVMIIIVAVPVATFVIKRLWNRFRSWLSSEQQKNRAENQDREEFRTEIQEFLGTADEESLKCLSRRRVFKWARRRAVRPSLDVMYLILTRSAFVNKKEALEEYVKRHKFKDSMVRLATVVWVFWALLYLIFPDKEWAGEAALAAVNVLPIHVATMFVMYQSDEAREEVFRELVLLFPPHENSGSH
jgi:hypothetical protein